MSEKKLTFLITIHQRSISGKDERSFTCEAESGETIALACARAGFFLPTPCGGQGRCKKCKVQLLEGHVSGGTLLGDMPDNEGWICACRARPASDITISCLSCGELGINEVLAEKTENRFLPSGAGIKRAGVAVDIGTTTVSAKLIDLETLLTLETISELNDQWVYGADIMSRISAAKKGETEKLFMLINRQIEKILTAFRELRDIHTVERLSVSGNTVMLHLFLNVDPSGMGAKPFTPAFLEEKVLQGKTISLSVEQVLVLPSIAAFIGGDITAGLAALDITNIPGPSLLVDIGTNGEMALVKDGNIYCCSTAAGPAFEGAEISCGAGGIKGAISGVRFAENDETTAFSITTIGNVPPVGICGSGLIDAVAMMLRKGVIDEAGYMAAPEKKFILAPGISISQRDIRQFQLAKSAIFSGIRILCKTCGLHTKDIHNVFIAGGLGFFINKHNAVTAGIFPKEFLETISVSGNLSLRGAEECLTDSGFLEKCKHIISRCSVIDLATDSSFTDEFSENMFFH
ncbi:MAG: ASKHA domain-containing protein [Treponema sp.]|nr:ASKHA domain-containing protein [Treponema sp.]